MEIIAVIFTLISVYLTIKSSIWCWSTGIIGIVAYLYIFLIQHLYSQSALQIFFIIQSIYGWYYWGKNKEVKYNWISTKKLIIDLVAVLTLLSIFTLLESKTNNPQPMLDVLTTLLSLLATWYMAKKIIFHWLIWIICDIFTVLLFMNQKLYWSAGLYTLLMIMCINGLITWFKLKENE
jgi:nicotinamide mononucleotide transporter